MAISDVQKAFDDLKVVREMIDRTRSATMESGKLFIWWGFLTIVAEILTYFCIKHEWYMHLSLVWGLFLVAGYSGTYLHVRNRRKNGVRSFIDRVIGATWGACGFTIIILTFIAPNLGAYDWNYIPPMVLIILAIGVYISSILYSWRTLGMFAYLWWIGAIVMFIWPETSLLLMGILVGGGMIALGIMSISQRKQNQLNSSISL